MRFRYKVIICNLILLSVSLGMVGYLMIQKNFDLALQTQLQHAIVENNLVQSSVEYEILQVYYDNKADLKDQLADIGMQVKKSLLVTDFSFGIRFQEKYLYSSDEKQSELTEEIFEQLDVGGKNYIITQEAGSTYIYVVSYSNLGGDALNIISKSDITEVYDMLADQSRYFCEVILFVLAAASVLIYLISTYMTRPLEHLTVISDEIAEGNYGKRAEVVTGDEVGVLAERFNHMAQAVQEHIVQLETMVHRRDQFVADFTHEIKTPMTTIIGYSDTLRSMELPRQEQIMALNYIFSEGQRLEKMSGKLFDLIYLRENGIEKRAIHVQDLAKEIQTITTPILAGKQQILNMEIEPAVIEGSRELLVTAFVNLVDNARKASDQGKTIALRGQRLKEQGRYLLSVIDEGTGMPRESIEHICDEFYMVNKSRSRQEGGAGLGMSLVALILEHHGAFLDIESTLGEGTKMKVYFSLFDMEKKPEKGEGSV